VKRLLVYEVGFHWGQLPANVVPPLVPVAASLVSIYESSSSETLEEHAQEITKPRTTPAVKRLMAFAAASQRVQLQANVTQALVPVVAAQGAHASVTALL
jgi:hypothetical protein